jgi:hypothetical protein
LEACDSDYGDDSLSQYSIATSQTPSFLRASFLYSKPDDQPFGMAVARRGSLHERQSSVVRQPSVSRFQNKYKGLDIDDEDINGSISSASHLGKYSNSIGMLIFLFSIKFL